MAIAARDQTSRRRSVLYFSVRTLCTFDWCELLHVEPVVGVEPTTYR